MIGTIEIEPTLTGLVRFGNMTTTKTMVAGDTRTMVCSAFDSDGAPLDLTGYDVEFRARSDSLTIDKSIGDGIELLTQSGATLGHVRITLLPVDTTSVSVVTNFRIEVQITSGGGIVSTVVQDSIRIVPALI
jgi:hypothetical protein